MAKTCETEAEEFFTDGCPKEPIIELELPWDLPDGEGNMVEPGPTPTTPPFISRERPDTLRKQIDRLAPRCCGRPMSNFLLLGRYKCLICDREELLRHYASPHCLP